MTCAYISASAVAIQSPAARTPLRGRRSAGAFLIVLSVWVLVAAFASSAIAARTSVTSGSASRPQLNLNCSRITGGEWGRDAHYTVLDSVNISCRHAMEILLRHDPSAADGDALFEEGSHEIWIGGYRCETYDFDPRTYPPTYTHGSGRARCVKGLKSFRILYAA